MRGAGGPRGLSRRANRLALRAVRCCSGRGGSLPRPSLSAGDLVAARLAQPRQAGHCCARASSHSQVSNSPGRPPPPSSSSLSAGAPSVSVALGAGGAGGAGLLAAPLSPVAAVPWYVPTPPALATGGRVDRLRLSAVCPRRLSRLVSQSSAVRAGPPRCCLWQALHRPP